MHTTKHTLLAPPVFVVGYMHSGTTLLHNILANHETIFTAADETRYFGYLPLISSLYPNLNDDKTLADLVLLLADLVENGDPARLRRVSKHYQPDQTTLTDADLTAITAEMQHVRTYGGIFRIVFDYLTQRAGKTRWLEKTPQHVFLIDDILQDIPNALFIEIVRDPRDILASKKKRKQTISTSTQYEGEAKRIKTLERVYDPFWDSLEWRLALRAGQHARQKYPDRMHSVHYEDLITDPESVVSDICAFLNLDFKPEMLDVRWWNTAEGDRTQRKGIVSDAMGRWTQTLSGSEIALCQWLTGEQFNRAGYNSIPASLSARLVIPWWVLRGSVGLIDRLIHRWQLGGCGFLMNTIKNYWKEFRKLIKSR